MSPSINGKNNPKPLPIKPIKPPHGDPRLGGGGNILKPLPVRDKPGIPNGPTVDKIYKTY